MRLSLTPRRMSATATRTWCTGTFHGSILQTQRFACAPPHLCPLIEIRPQTIAPLHASGSNAARIARRAAAAARGTSGAAATD